MPLKIKQKGDWHKSYTFLKRLRDLGDPLDLEKYGTMGVAALAAATPKDTGKTAASWYYEIDRSEEGKIKLNFYNSNINNGVNIAIILQYGHGTGNGGYVEGQDYINPAVKPVFEEMAQNAWEEVSRL